MRKKNYKGKCIKRQLEKCKGICKSYDDIQNVYADALQNNNEILSFQCNIPFNDSEIGNYTTDFICTKTTGEIIIRECVYFNCLTRPTTVRLLDASRNYWLKRGIIDTTDALIRCVSQVAINHISLLVVDEIQNVCTSTSGHNLIGCLTQLINSSGISLCFVGTPVCVDFFESTMQLARRSIGLSYGIMMSLKIL